ncbi:hypothetical protein [Glycomyces arizonensis]|uniref:hypothetical protein n=1 Tax=Glycomyces arizonensis TaxID=256035 RepID=UPI00042507BA|nr:hypothetical protein [Glycomyces arizonensis]
MIRTSIPDSIERGAFSDGVHSFSVRASSGDAPDFFQVYTSGKVAEIVLVVSGLNAGTLKATWGLNWVTASEEWREWCEAEAFMVFYNGTKPAVGRVRVCNG